MSEFLIMEAEKQTIVETKTACPTLLIFFGSTRVSESLHSLMKNENGQGPDLD